MPENRRILLVAYACNPRGGSEPGVGWGWVKSLAPIGCLTVLTAAFNRHDIQRAVAQGSADLKRVSFAYVPHGFWHFRPTRAWRLIEKSCLKPLMNLAYCSWQRSAAMLAEEVHAAEQFDLVHLITYVGFRFPGRFDQLGIPFVWGPIGGLENTPWRFLPTLGLYGCVYYAARNIINSLQKRLLPGPRRAMARAAESGGIIAATEGIRREIRRSYGHDSQVICEIGPPPFMAATHSIRHPGQPLRLAWSGQHLPGKALPLLLKALALLPQDMDWHLIVLGAGPCTLRWRKLANRLNLDGRNTWTGQLSRYQSIQRMAQAHVFIITSLKDLTSTVLLEALSQGVPVICPDHCGFSNVVTPNCGIKLPVISPRQIQRDLAAAILRLAHDEPERRRLAAGALRRIHDFSWEKKAEQVDAIYRRAVARHAAAQADATPAPSPCP